MALEKLRHPENVPGDFFVDTSCIDCDLCRQIAPETFSSVADQSVVFHQPQTSQERLKALKALVTCPTSSIGAPSNSPVQDAIRSYPEQVEDEVYFCGFASESSYGASSYLIVRPSGNVLVDSPRFNKPLADQISALGGIQTIFLTHRDDVADQSEWAKQFGADRVMHSADAGRLGQNMERVVSGYDAVPLDDDLILIPTPGHTRGHAVLLYRKRFLFSGDHVWWSESFRSLHASRSVCWFSWPDQITSMERLLDYSFEWVLPGHGRRIFLPEPQMRASLMECIRRMKAASR
jgi:glyoxylase-like metal-dependent hydrolase (beta-lactamase superfamily II)/ferredoxin